MKKKILIVGICCLYLIIISSIFTYVNVNVDNVVYENITPSLQPVVDIKTSYEKIINEYRDKYNNDDVVGEINIVNGDYKKAIVQTRDNDYYLNHLEDKTSSYMGSIYLDFRVNINDSDKLLIYGHNSSKVEMPFKILENYYSKSYYNDHKYIEITTDNKIRKYEIYSVLVEISDFGYMKTDFKNEEEWYLHIKSFKDKSMYDTGVDVNKDDNILILQTCSTHSDYRKYNKKYLLIVGKEISGN